MGDAYAAAADEAGALYWNPAALTSIENRSALLAHAAYLDSSAYEYAAFAQRLGRGAYGLGLQYFSAGSIPETDAAGVETGSFAPSDLAFSVGYARKLEAGSAGVAVKLVRSRILKTAQTAALDAGLLSAPQLDGRLRLAATVSNLGGSLRYDDAKEELPAAFRLGAAAALSERWTATLDLALPRDNRPYPALGTEYRVKTGERMRLALRAGFNARAVGDVEGFSGVSFGLGFTLDRAALDYAAVPFGDLGMTHRIGLSLAF